MRRVVKVGGSLLRRSQLSQDLGVWLSSQTPGETLIVVGGGELIDAMRNLDQVRPSDPAAIHWRCVDLLQTTFLFAKDWFRGWESIATAEEFRQSLAAGFSSDRPTLVAVGSFYRDDSGGLPNDWTTTSDAIAALLAVKTSSDELVLLKSCEVDDSLSIDDLVAAGIVDAALPLIAGQVSRLRVEKLAET